MSPAIRQYSLRPRPAQAQTVVRADSQGASGRQWLDGLALPQPYSEKVLSLRQPISELTTEITMLSHVTADLLAGDHGYQLIQQLPDIGPVLVGCAGLGKRYIIRWRWKEPVATRAPERVRIVMTVPGPQRGMPRPRQKWPEPPRQIRIVPTRVPWT